MSNFRRGVESVDDLLAEHGRALFRLAYLLTGRQHDAEDLMQDTCLKLTRRWPLVAAASNPRAYATRILVNQHISSTRKQRLVTVRLTETQPNLPTAPDAGHSVVERELLREGLLKLPDRQRAIVVLRHYEGRDIQEIGELLGIGESSVRSALSRGLAALRNNLNSEETEPHDA